MNAEPPEEFGIAELAERAKVTPRTIRYYVAERLLPPPGGTGQHRVYTEEHLLRLEAIKRLKAAYLPLAAIRDRLTGLSVAELNRLVETPVSAARNSALDYIASILNAEPRTRTRYPRPTVASERELPRPQIQEASGPAYAEPPRMQTLGYESSPVMPSASFLRAIRSSPSADEAPASTVWHRVTLATGVELHYQLSGDRRRDAAVVRFIREATRLFGEAVQSESRTRPDPPPARS